MSKKQECVACQGLLDWESRDQKSTPHLHHNHETGIVRGFVHPFCNAIEGQIRLAAGRLNIGKFLKTMFPEVFSQA